jgi:putative inorganic carbon (hco3(-)) transporter
MKLVSWCNRVIFISFLFLFALVPIILTPWNYELFEFNKMIVTYFFTILIAGAWGVKMAAGKEVKIRKTPFDIPILLFVASQIVSALFSMDPHVSWFGYYSRFNGGVLSIISYVVLFYAFISNWQDIAEQSNSKEKPTRLFLATLFGTSIIVSVYGILERLGIDKHLWVQDVQSRVFSTLGQPNWLAAYLVALLPVSLGAAVQSMRKDKKKWQFTATTFFLLFITVLYYVTLLFTRSRSGLAGLGIAIAIFVTGLCITKQIQKTTMTVLAVVAVFLVGITFFNGSNISQIDNLFSYQALKAKLAPTKQQEQPAQTAASSGTTLLEFGGTESGTIRKYVWQAALTGWKATPKNLLIGTGTETFAFAFFEYKPKAHNLTSEWDFLYNKAHNEYLNYLTTTGIFGIGTYLAFLGLICLWYVLLLKNETNAKDESDEKRFTAISPVGIGLFAGWISILVTNFFGFSVVVVQLFLFLFPALLVVMRKHDSKNITISLAKFPRGIAISFLTLSSVITVIGLAWVVTYWIADSYYATGYRSSRSGQLAESYKSLAQAVILRPGEPAYYDELSVVLSGLSLASIQIGNATSAANFAQQSIAASDKALTISPNNVNFWKSRTKIYYGFSTLDPKFTQAAISSLEKASELSPVDPKITYNLAVLYGRLGQNEKAIDLLRKTIDMKPNYRDSYYALYVFYVEVKQPDMAKSVLEQYLKLVDPNDADFKDRIKQL